MKFLDCYTWQMARCLRTQYFFSSLKESCPEDSPKYLLAIQFGNDCFKRKVTVGDVKNAFDDDVIQASLRKATAKCLLLAEKRCSSDSSLKTCVVCFDQRANYYIIHEDLAHKSVCATCAMTLSLRDNPTCPMSRAPISFFLMAAATESIECVCKESDCIVHVLVKQDDKDRFQAARECHTCTLESFSSKEDLRIFDVYCS